MSGSLILSSRRKTHAGVPIMRLLSFAAVLVLALVVFAAVGASEAGLLRW